MWYFRRDGHGALYHRMYSIRHTYLRAFFNSLLLVSSLVLFGNRLTDRFHLCTSLSGGLYRIQDNSNHWYSGHTDFGAHFGKVLASMDKRYHSPVGVALDEPSFRIVPVVVPAVQMGYHLPLAPVGSGTPCLFLRGPPSCC